MRFKLILLILGLAAWVVSNSENSKTDIQKPNILLILVDDLGWGDLG